MFPEAQRPHAASPGAIVCEKAHHCEFPANTAVTVKLLLPPRQSRGVSQRTRLEALPGVRFRCQRVERSLT
jgi:hypothetical protein